MEHKILWYNGLRISGRANYRTLKCVSAWTTTHCTPRPFGGVHRCWRRSSLSECVHRCLKTFTVVGRCTELSECVIVVGMRPQLSECVHRCRKAPQLSKWVHRCRNVRIVVWMGPPLSECVHRCLNGSNVAERLSQSSVLLHSVPPRFGTLFLRELPTRQAHHVLAEPTW